MHSRCVHISTTLTHSKFEKPLKSRHSLLYRLGLVIVGLAACGRHRHQRLLRIGMLKEAVK